MRFVILFLLAIQLANAYHSPTLAGTGGLIDRMGIGIAQLGMGNTGALQIHHAGHAYWNPALLAFPAQNQAIAGADVRWLSRNGSYLGWQGRLAPRLGAGIVIANRGDFDVPVYDEQENLEGTARPQEFLTYLALGWKLTRFSGIGFQVGNYSRYMDLGGAGDGSMLGLFGISYYNRLFPNLEAVVSIRNLGLNSDFSARYDIVSDEESALGFSATGNDYWPKTTALGFRYLPSFAKIPKEALSISVELLDFLLEDDLWAWTLDHHQFDFRLGSEYILNPWIVLRGGYDRGNLSLGGSYTTKLGRKNNLTLDYALLLERNFTFLNPFSLGIRFGW